MRPTNSGIVHRFDLNLWWSQNGIIINVMIKATGISSNTTIILNPQTIKTSKSATFIGHQPGKYHRQTQCGGRGNRIKFLQKELKILQTFITALPRMCCKLHCKTLFGSFQRFYICHVYVETIFC